MKVKVKFDFGRLKGWIFEHGEKLAFGAMALVCLLFMYSATRSEVLDAGKQPDRMRDLAQQVDQKVRSSAFDEKIAGVQVVDYTARAKREEISLTAFANNPALNPPLVDPMGKREDPTILNVEELQAHGGYGSFALSSGTKSQDGKSRTSSGSGSSSREGFRPSPESNLRATPWAVLTGLVPVSKQAAEFQRVFGSAMGADSGRDTPSYLGVDVERAEVDPAKPDDLQWQKVDAGIDFEKQWEGKGDEVVEKDFVDPQLTRPLGPMVDRSWDATVAHPKIPVRWASESAPAAAAQTKTSQTQAGGTPPKPANSAPGYALMRVFDYKVEPRKSYRYRVKVKLANPNYKVEPSFLKDPSAATNSQEFRAPDDWVELASPVTIPSGFGILAGGVESKANEPSINLLLTAIDQKEGIPAATEAKVFRGNVANKREPKLNAMDPRSKKSIVLNNMNFDTSIVVVDIFGGKPISQRARRESPLSAPAEVLLLDPAGNLIVRSDLDDLATYEQRKPPEDEEPPPKKSPGDEDSKAKKKGGQRTTPKGTTKAASKASPR